MSVSNVLCGIGMIRGGRKSVSGKGLASMGATQDRTTEGWLLQEILRRLFEALEQ